MDDCGSKKNLNVKKGWVDIDTASESRRVNSPRSENQPVPDELSIHPDLLRTSPGLDLLTHPDLCPHPDEILEGPVLDLVMHPDLLLKRSNLELRTRPDLPSNKLRLNPDIPLELFLK